MKYNKLKSILTLLTVSFCLSATAGEVVNVRLCDETAPFLIGCSQFSTTGPYSVDVDGTQKTLNLIYGHSSPVTELKDTIEAGQTYLFACQQLSGAAGAELTASETFTNVTGCDSVVNLKLKVKAACTPTSGTETATIKVGESYLFGCEVIEAAGVGTITRTNTLVNAAGCDSIVTLTLTVEAACEPTEGTETATIKVGESYLFGCEVIEATEVGPITRTNTLVNVAGCDSVVTLTLTVEAACEPTEGTETATIKVGESYLFGCEVIEATEVGPITRTNTLVNAAGCDSVVTLTLTVEAACEPTEGTETATIKVGESYLFGCEVIEATEVGPITRTNTLVNAAGCDSVVTLTLTVEAACEPTEGTETATIKVGESYLFGCEVIEATEVGPITRTNTLVNAAGCDSVVTLTLTVEAACEPTTGTETATIKVGESYLFGCEVIEATEVGPITRTNTLVNAAGCDSVVTLTLTVEAACEPTEGTETATIKVGDSYLFGCEVIETTEVGPITRTNTLVNAAGCDSIVTLTLTVEAACEPTEGTETATIKVGESYLFGCEVIEATEVGPITRTNTLVNAAGCDSVVTLTLTVEAACEPTEGTETATIKVGESYLFGCEVIEATEVGPITRTNTLVNAAGCDSIITLTLTVNPNTVYTDTVANVCEGDMPYTWHGYVIYNDTVCSDTIDLTTYDSIVTLTLNVLRVQYAEVADSVICEGASCNWRGKTYSKEGLYYDTLRYANKCDSMIYQLSVREAKVTHAPVEYAVSCNGEMYTWKGSAYWATGIYHYTERYVSCDCDSVIYTLDLTVNPAPTDLTLDTTICDGDFIEWFGHKYSVAGKYYDTLYYTTGCDSVRGTLQLHVRKLTTEAPLLDTICAGEEYDWYGTKITEAGIYYDTIQYVGSACDSIARMLILTVNQPVTVEISETWCLAAARAEYPDLNITGTGDYTRVGTSALGCDSTTIYHLTILKTPEVPALGNLLFQPVVACGYPILLDSARVAVAAELAMTQADDIAKVDYFWFEMQLTPTSEFKQITSDVIMSYTEEPIQIRLVLYTECDEAIYGEPVAYEVVKPSPEEIAEYDEMPAVSKYNNWLLMINVNKITEMGFDVKEEDVTWYQVINDIDPAGQHIDDKEVGKGFYFTADMSLTGQYYAVIETDKTEINECGAILRTLVVKCTTDGKMRLVPNTIHEGETMEVRNINPDENTTFWMYDRDGKLLEKHVSDGQEQYTIQPEQNAGVYLLRVVNGKQEESFKYVITK